MGKFAIISFHLEKKKKTLHFLCDSNTIMKKDKND